MENMSTLVDTSRK